MLTKINDYLQSAINSAERALNTVDERMAKKWCFKILKYSLLVLKRKKMELHPVCAK